MVDYKAEFEAAMEARDAAGWLGTSPAETIKVLSEDLRRLERYLQIIAHGPWPDGIDTPERHAQFDDHVARSALYLPQSESYAPFPKLGI